jgi:MFS family permease
LTAGGLALAGAGVLVIALAHGTVALLIGLGVAGLGLGTFMPPNNTAIMAAAPRNRTGLVGGMLNMTRGAGTALGVAVAGVIYAVAAGGAGTSQATVASAGHGLALTMAVLAALALATSLAVAVARRSSRPHRPERRKRPIHPVPSHAAEKSVHHRIRTSGPGDSPPRITPTRSFRAACS